MFSIKPLLLTFSSFILYVLLSGDSVSFDAEPKSLSLGEDGLAVVSCYDKTVSEQNEVLGNCYSL